MATPPMPPRQRQPEPEPVPGHPSWCDPAECRAHLDEPHRGRLHIVKALHGLRIAAQIYQPPAGAEDAGGGSRAHPARVRLVVQGWGRQVEADLAPPQAGELAEVLDALAEQVGD